MKTKPYNHKVLYRECDMMKVVNNAVYAHWLEDARVDALRQLGLEYRELENGGFAGPVLDVELKYLRPARMDDEIAITVSFDKYTGARLMLSYEVVNAVTGQLLCVAKSSHCFISMKTGRAVLIREHYPEWNDTLINATK